MTHAIMKAAAAAALCAAMWGCGGPGVQGSSDNPVSPQQALGRQGQNVTVEGVARVSEADGMPGVFIRLDNPRGPHVPFVGYISVNNEGMFPDLRELDGRRIDISGVVETTGTIPMIRLTSADQITIVR
jgi:hypothetical protein